MQPRCEAVERWFDEEANAIGSSVLFTKTALRPLILRFYIALEILEGLIYVLSVAQ